MASDSRPYDVVLFGATGFVGRLTAAYLARVAPAGLRWAIAGRSSDKLAALRDELGGAPDTCPADVADPASLRTLAERTRVLATTVGPYVLYGEPVVAACAAAGTDYLDLTGEPEFVNNTYIRHHATAAASGARLVHAAGFDSIPHDLGAYYTVLQLPEEVPLRVAGFVRMSAAFSGGTFHSALTGFSRARQNLTALRKRRAAEPPRSDGRRVHAGPGRPGRDPINGEWALPFPSLDPQVVGASARANPRYGPDFRYAHHMTMPRLSAAAGTVGGAAALAVAAQLPAARRALLKRLAPGDGPSAEKRARSWFRVTFLGEGGGARVVTQVSGRDPGYDETAMMLGESALCLALDDLPSTAGQVTTATAMGDALLSRLPAAGMRFEVLERS
jgi:short subunit dehydrogenase-like uncharacterized protein